MQISLQIEGKTLIVALSGELDHHSAGSIRDVIEKNITKKEVRNLIFDFSKLTFMDSSGIGMIIGRYKLIRALGGQVFVVCKSDRVKKMMQMSGLTKLIGIVSSMEEALKEVHTV